MTPLSLKARLENFLRKYYSEKFIPSGDLQRIVAEKTTYSPQNVGRRMRELENEGVVEVKYVRGHAHYRYREAESFEAQRQKSLQWFEDLPVVVGSCPSSDELRYRTA
jgi:DNA-binding Lrp family transcriptional regulator